MMNTFPDKKLVLLKRYAIAFEAEIAKGLLADVNIDSFLFDCLVLHILIL